MWKNVCPGVAFLIVYIVGKAYLTNPKHSEVFAFKKKKAKPDF